MQLQITDLTGWLAVALVLVGGLAMLYRRRQGRRRKSWHKRRVMEVPQVWPFDPRRVASVEERKVWSWLREVFPAHQVLLKLPITRFVTPHRPDRAREWQHLLSGVYCTFTVCTGDGRVVGCLDVMDDPDALPRLNRQIKETLLEQCGINYWAVVQDRLPSGETLRTEFLDSSTGGEPSQRPPSAQPRPLDDVRQRLHQTLDRNRAWRAQNTIPAPLDSGFACLSQPMYLSSRQKRRAGLASR